jgi:hypothetical protein
MPEHIDEAWEYRVEDKEVMEAVYLNGIPKVRGLGLYLDFGEDSKGALRVSGQRVGNGNPDKFMPRQDSYPEIVTPEVIILGSRKPRVWNGHWYVCPGCVRSFYVPKSWGNRVRCSYACYQFCAFVGRCREKWRRGLKRLRSLRTPKVVPKIPCGDCVECGATTYFSHTGQRRKYCSIDCSTRCLNRRQALRKATAG